MSKQCDAIINTLFLTQCPQTRIYKCGREYLCAFHYNEKLCMYRNFHLAGNDNFTYEKVMAFEDYTDEQKKFITAEPKLLV